MSEKILYEKDIQREILEWLQSQAYFFWRSNNVPVYGQQSGGKFGYRALPKFTPKGLPDIVIVFRGFFVGVEVKRPGNRAIAKGLSEDQVKFRQQLQDHGGFYILAHSLEEMKKEFEQVREIIAEGLV